MCTTCGCDYHSNMDHEEMHKHGIAHEHHHETSGNTKKNYPKPCAKTWEKPRSKVT